MSRSSGTFSSATKQRQQVSGISSPSNSNSSSHAVSRRSSSTGKSHSTPATSRASPLSSSTVFSEVDVLQRKDVMALLAWLESFPTFEGDIQISDEWNDGSDCFDLIQSLDEPSNLQKVGCIAAEILEGADSDRAQKGMPPLSELAASLPQQPSPWNLLLEATEKIARPDNVVISLSASKSTREVVLKVRVLANLLDCVVNHSNLTVRRQYIARILKLHKTAQRHLMGMIERRIRASASSSSNPPSSSKSRLGSDSHGNKNDTPSSNQKIPAPRPILRRPNSTRRHENHAIPDTGPSSSDSEESQYQPKTPSREFGSPGRRKQGASIISSAALPSCALKPEVSSGMSSNTPQKLPSTPHTTAKQRHSSFLSTPGSATSGAWPLDIMSPTAVIDSPEKAQRWIQQLQKKNQDLQIQVTEMQERERSLQSKQEESRLEMMKLESSYINKQNEMDEEHKRQLEEMQRMLNASEKEKEKNAEAEKMLKRLQDELEVANHSQAALSEAQERLCSYKERVQELQDVKEALEREQEAHGKAVEDVLRLQTEVKGLQQSRRQLDDYKTRAIEAEVKLVECQESLRRLELELSDADELKHVLSKESIMQKEQLQEMVNRIKEETQSSIETKSDGFVLGEGLSELNPQVKSELTRLRHENLQLRAFAAKRQDDAVEHLESKLDDCQRFSEKYKQEYLSTKDKLQTTESELCKTRRELSKQVDELKAQVRQRESRVLFLTEQLESSNIELEKTKESLAESEQSKKSLQQKVKQISSSLQEKSELARKSRNQVDELTETLRTTHQKLQTSEKARTELQETSDSWEKNAKAVEEEVVRAQDEIQELHAKFSSAREELEHARITIAELEEKLDRAHEHNKDLDARFQEESQSNAKALEATKEILTSRYKQQLEDQSSHFTRLLEEERAENNRLKESSRKERDNFEQDKQSLESRMKLELKQMNEEANSKIAKLQEEHDRRVAELKDEVTQTRKDGEEKMQQMIRKGRDLINDCKEKARTEMKRLDEENKTLDEQLQEERYSRKQEEESMRKTVGALKSRLEQSTTRINDLTQEADDLQEQLKVIRVARDKLQDDNERYRRQLSGSGGGIGGRFGAQQFEKLQKEFNAVVEENRNLRRQSRMYQNSSGGSQINSIEENSSSRRDRGSTITQLRQEYEETITALNDEKRELVMKNTAAMTEVERAEKRTWDREQEVTNLKSQLTSLKLELERVHLSNGADSTTASVSSYNTGSSAPLPPHGVRTPPHTPPRRSSHTVFGDSTSPSGSTTPPPSSSHSYNRKLKATRSPTIDRALREKEQHENFLRQQISSLRRTPTRKIGGRP